MDMSIRFPNLQVIFGYIPKSFQVFGYEITVYGILLAAAMLLALAIIVTEAKRKNQDQNVYLGASVLAILLGLVGARLWYGAMHWKLYRGNPAELLDIRGGGFSFWGSAFGRMLGTGSGRGHQKQNFGEMADTVSIGLVSGQIIAVWGTFFSREAFGEYTNSMFAMDLPDVRPLGGCDGAHEGASSGCGRRFLHSGASTVFCTKAFGVWCFCCSCCHARGENVSPAKSS